MRRAALWLLVFASFMSAKAGAHDRVRFSGAPRIFVEARVDGRGPFRCLIDSAFTHSAFDPAVPQADRRLHKVSLGHSSFVVTKPRTMSLGGIEEGPRLYCIIGADLFDRYVVTVDYTRSTLTIDRPWKFAFGGRGPKIRLRNDANRLLVTMRLTVAGRSVLRQERLDTESEETVADDLVDGSSVRRYSNLHNGHLSGLYDRVQIGPYAFENVWGPSSPNRTVGTELLRRFLVTIDVPHEALYLLPNGAIRDPIPTPPPAW